VTWVLAIDLGTSGPKVAVASTDGQVADHDFEPVELVLRPGSGAVQRPDDWWGAITAASRAVLGRGAVPAGEIGAVAVTGQWAGTVAVGADGEPLGDAITWMDARGGRYSRRVAGGRVRVRVGGYGPLEVARWVRHTGGAPSLSGRDPVGHILHLKHDAPDVYRATQVFLEPVDWVNLKLTGTAAASVDTATLTWTVDTRDLANPRHHEPLVALTTIDRAKLPDVRPTASVLGELTDTAAQALGLPAGGGVKVTSATPDLMSAAVGSGAVGDYAGHLYVGTSSWIACHMPVKRTDVLHAIAALPAALPGRYLIVTEQQTAGASLERLRDAWFAGTREADLGYEELAELAATSEPGSGGVVFAPWLNGERCPVEDEHVRGGWFGMSLATTRADLVRATFEGVALNARWMQGYVEKFARRELDPLNFVGGGAKSAFWGQVFADVLGRRVRRVAEPVLANARGAALVAGVALGERTAADLDGIVEIVEEHVPDPSVRAVYDARFETLKKTYKGTRRNYRG
jgi:xylulokinase